MAWEGEMKSITSKLDFLIEAFTSVEILLLHGQVVVIPVLCLNSDLSDEDQEDEEPWSSASIVKVWNVSRGALSMRASRRIWLAGFVDVLIFQNPLIMPFNREVK